MNTKTQAQTDTDCDWLRELCSPHVEHFNAVCDAIETAQREHKSFKERDAESAQECPEVHGEDCTDDHCQCDCHFSFDDPHEDSREVNGR